MSREYWPKLTQAEKSLWAGPTQKKRNKKMADRPLATLRHSR